MRTFLITVKLHEALCEVRVTKCDCKTILRDSLVVQWLRLCFHYRGHRFDAWCGN